MRKLRLRFWRWAHKKAEQLWHWIYRRKLQPLEEGEPPMLNPVDRYFFSHRYVRPNMRYGEPEEPQDWGCIDHGKTVKVGTYVGSPRQAVDYAERAKKWKKI